MKNKVEQQMFTSIIGLVISLLLILAFLPSSELLAQRKKLGITLPELDYSIDKIKYDLVYKSDSSIMLNFTFVGYGKAKIKEVKVPQKPFIHFIYDESKREKEVIMLFLNIIYTDEDNTFHKEMFSYNISYETSIINNRKLYIKCGNKTKRIRY